VSLSKSKLFLRLQQIELPPDERIIVRVHRGSDERPSPVREKTKALEVLFRFRWEVFEPVVRVLEFRYFFLSHPQIKKNLILCHLFLIFEQARIHLSLQPEGSCLDRHSCAMESKGIESIFPYLFLISDLKFTL